MDRIVAGLPVLVSNAIIIGTTVVLALAVHWIVTIILSRAARRTASGVDDMLLRKLRQPSRWLLVVLALSFVHPALGLDPAAERIAGLVAGLLLPALFGWLAIACLGAAYQVVEARTDIAAPDNLLARSRRTRISILYRIGVFLVLLVTICMMLISIPSVRNVGVTLIASAGLAGLAVGAAAQPALKNLIAGIQMAFTEPIRIDDVVIIEGEWGRIEEIHLTFVIVKIWDERRLVVPVSKFLENSFQNWTRETSQLLGSVLWYLDPTADVDRFRAKLEEVVKANPLWDGRFQNVQVTDTRPEAIEVRALMTARDASRTFDLRCDVREAMLAFVRREMPEAIARHRTVIERRGDTPTRDGTGAS